MQTAGPAADAGTVDATDVILQFGTLRAGSASGGRQKARWILVPVIQLHIDELVTIA